MPQRIQRKRVKGWRKPDGVVDVTRGSKYGNPYKVSLIGMRYYIERDERTIDIFDFKRIAIHRAIVLFRAYAEDRLLSEPDWLDALRDKDLMCWCDEDAECHGDVLLELANR